MTSFLVCRSREGRVSARTRLAGIGRSDSGQPRVILFGPAAGRAETRRAQASPPLETLRRPPHTTLDQAAAVRYMDAMLVRALLLAALVGAASAGGPCAHAQSTAIPRTPDGRPNLQGIWQTHNRAAVDLELHVAHDGMPAGEGVVVGGEIPY